MPQVNGFAAFTAVTPTSSTTAATVVNPYASTLTLIAAYNQNASPRFLKFYDKAVLPTAGSDTPVLNIMLPGSTTGAGSNLPIGANAPIAMGFGFANGLSYCVTGAINATDFSGITGGDVIVNLGYK